MTRKARAAIVLGCAVALVGAGAGGAPSLLPVVGEAEGVEIAGGTLFDLALPAAVLDQASACPTGLPCAASLLLVGSSGAPELANGEPGSPLPRRLLRLALAEDGGRWRARLREQLAAAPDEVEAVVVADLDLDGRPEVLLGGPERLWSLGRLDDPQAAAAIAEGPGFDLVAVRRLLLPGAAGLAVTGVGRLERWQPAPDGRLTRTATAVLPVSARRAAHGLELTSPPVAALVSASGRPLYLAGPEDLGGGRLRTLVVEAGEDGDAMASWEAWAQLPGAESVAGSVFAVLDDRPCLIAFTYPSDKIGVFAQKRLRVLPLSPDRTRAGTAPWLAAETTSHRWQRAVARVGDWNGDGRDDLAVAQVKGLGGKGILVQLYLGRTGGGFARKPAKTRIDEELEGWSFRDDLDGDGLPELALADDDGRVSIHASGDRARGGAIGERPRWRIELPPPAGADPDAERVVNVRVGDDGSEVEVTFGPGLPEAVDLDADGRPELVFLQAVAGGATAVRIVRLNR